MTQSISSPLDESSLNPSHEQQLLISPIKDDIPMTPIQLGGSSASNTVPPNSPDVFNPSTTLNQTPQLFTPSQQIFTPTLGTNPQQYHTNGPPTIPTCFVQQSNNGGNNNSEQPTNSSIIDLGGDGKWNANGVPQDSLNAIFNSVVYDEVGNRHEMHKLWSDFKTIFIFVRVSQLIAILNIFVVYGL